MYITYEAVVVTEVEIYVKVLRKPKRKKQVFLIYRRWRGGEGEKRLRGPCLGSSIPSGFSSCLKTAASPPSVATLPGPLLSAFWSQFKAYLLQEAHLDYPSKGLCSCFCALMPTWTWPVRALPSLPVVCLHSLQPHDDGPQYCLTSVP